jgi:hypothetical protein
MIKNFNTNFIPETINNTPFKNIHFQNFFARWCKGHENILDSKFIERDKWKNLNLTDIFSNNTLLLPNDLQLYEMIDIIKLVDHDTFSRNTEKDNNIII